MASSLLLLLLLTAEPTPAAPPSPAVPAEEVKPTATAADEHFTRGLEALKAQDSATAITELSACVQALPSRVDCRWELGWAYSLENRWARRSRSGRRCRSSSRISRTWRARSPRPAPRPRSQERLAKPPDPHRAPRPARGGQGAHPRHGRRDARHHRARGPSASRRAPTNVLAGVRALLRGRGPHLREPRGPAVRRRRDEEVPLEQPVLRVPLPTSYAPGAQGRGGGRGLHGEQPLGRLRRGVPPRDGGHAGHSSASPGAGRRAAWPRWSATGCASAWWPSTPRPRATTSTTCPPPRRWCARWRPRMTSSSSPSTAAPRAARPCTCRTARRSSWARTAGDLRTFTHAMVDSGAHVVLGHGPHVARAMEFYKGRLIAYSMGNFATYGRFNLRAPRAWAWCSRWSWTAKGRYLSGRILPTKQMARASPLPDRGGRRHLPGAQADDPGLPADGCADRRRWRHLSSRQAEAVRAAGRAVGRVVSTRS